ncbi:MAG TPA: hypothetical protein VM238_02640 [Phycisphaerae bacterium]|nr:hypothetical protein [Phycisphaerae bacterium]
MWYVIAYLVAVLVIGVAAARRQSAEGFMMADRQLGAFAVGSSVSAGFFDAFVLAVYAGYVYQYGLSALWLFVGVAVGLGVFALMARPIKEASDAGRFHTMADYFFARFPRDAKPGYAVAGLLVVFFLALLLVQFIFGSQVLAFLTGWSYTSCVLIVGIVVMLYMVIGGFRASVRTDVFQWLLIVLLASIVALVVRRDLAPSWAAARPLGIGIGKSAAFLVIGTLNTIVAADLWQRAYAAKSVQSLRRGLFLAALMLPLAGAVIGIIALATRQQFPGLDDPTQALLYGFGRALGEGWRGLGFVVLFAAIMSSADTMLFVIGSSVVKDFAERRRRWTDARRVRLVRYALGVAGLLGVIVAIAVQDILTIALSIAGLGIGLSPAVVAVRFFDPRSISVFVSIMLGAAAVGALLLSGYVMPETSLVSLPVALVALLITELLARIRGRGKSD